MKRVFLQKRGVVVEKRQFFKKISLFFFFVFCASHLNCGVTSWWKGRQFSTLKDLKAHARYVPEYPEMDNKDFLKPDYSSFYRSLHQGFFKRTWSKMKSWWPNNKSASWSPSVLKKLLESVSNKREEDLHYGNFVKKFTPPSGSQFVMWGNLHGSYHSIVRELGELKKQEVINNNLKIIKPNHYFVFNGNTINFSPFSLETLTAVLLLMKNNPQNVFYIKGPHESRKFCVKHGLRQELQSKIKKTKHFVSLERELGRLFNTLPMALYLRKKTGVITQFVQIANGSSVYKWGNEQQFRDFLHAPDYGRSQVFKLTKKSGGTAPNLPIDLYIDAENGFHSLVGVKGLKRRTGEKGAPSWSLFSGQTRTHRAIREFFYDSFVIFSLNDVFSRSTLSLYSRDTRKNEGFVKTTYLAFPKVLTRRLG